MKRIDLAGKQFGRWRVTGYAGRGKRNATMWACLCECGVPREVNSQDLRSGKSTSCGCFREENRPKLALNRDYSGRNNPRAKRSMSLAGGVWVPSSSVWYKRAAGVFHAAKKAGVPLGFTTAVSLAIYVQGIAPDRCPVFGEEFADRGHGFNKWSPSIDKIDPALGYVPGNLQVISVLANCMKRDATTAQLQLFADWIRRNN